MSASFVKSLFVLPEYKGPKAMTPDEERKFKLQGLRVVLGGALVHFVLGCFYLWGGISLYVASYLIPNDPSIDIDLVKMVFPFMNLTLCFGMPFGVKIAERIGGKLLMFAGVITIALITFITSFINSFYVYLVLYGLGVGLISGFLYVVAYSFGWKYFPNRKGFVSGSVLAGYGFGSLTWNFVALACVNPNNMKAIVAIGKSKYFTHEVYDNVPYMMRILALCYLLVGLLGCLLITGPEHTPLKAQPVPQTAPQPAKAEKESSHRPSAQIELVVDPNAPKTVAEGESPAKDGENDDKGAENDAKDAENNAKPNISPNDEVNPLAIAHQQTNTESHLVVKEEAVNPPPAPVVHECQSLSQGLMTAPFWMLLGMAFFGTFYGFLMANNYKVYGLLKLGDDNFVTTVGSIGSAANGCSRIFWATLLDKFGYRRVFFVLMVIQIIICGTLDAVSGIKALYLIWYALTMFCEGGILAMEPAVTGKIFGPKKGSLIYGFVFFGMAMANLVSFLLTKFATDLAWDSVFWICFAFSFVALFINFAFNQYYKFPPPKGAKAHIPAVKV